MPDLTELERKAALLVADGLPDKGVAHALGVSRSATRRVLQSLSAKIGAANRVQIAVWAVKNLVA